MADNDEKRKKDVAKSAADGDRLADAISTGFAQLNEGPMEVVTPPGQSLNVSLSGNSLDVTLHGTPTHSTDVQGFWEYLRQRTDAIAFGRYTTFIEDVLFKSKEGAVPTELVDPVKQFRAAKRLAGVDSYELLRLATEAFLLMQCGTLTFDPEQKITSEPFDGKQLQAFRFGDRENLAEELKKKLARYLGGNPTTPYVDRITEAYIGTEPANPLHNAVFADNIDAKVLEPCFIELIWSYWHEEAALVQTINAISLRFQNKRGPGDIDPLANLETHPLRPVANLLWGYVQDEDHRLTVARRSYEYEHQYGLSLVGKAVPKHAPADRRSQFLVTFHTLLHQAAIFYDRSANLTVRADAFPLLNALREVHLVLAEGAHNQFRELPWTARVEMLMQQWLLSRREVREFVGGRPAVPYAEEWMRTVDAMRRLMGWGDTSISNFHDLAITGEKIVLSIRFGDWSDAIVVTESDAAGWAVFWRPEIQRYIHAYQAVTGVDLSAATQVASRQIDATLPSVLLQQRMARQRR
jgi:hypothetical protein